MIDNDEFYPDVNDPDIVNINQVDIPITPNEKVEIRIASVSEAGFPYNPLKSDYSTSVTVDFPTPPLPEAMAIIF